MSKSSSSTLISYIYKSRKIILELMKRQGYSIEEYENFSINEVNSMTQNNQLDVLLEKKDDVMSTKMYIRYYLEKSLNPKLLDEMIDYLFNMEEVLTKNDTFMIIVKDDMNDTLRSALKHIWEKDGIFVVIQSIKRLQYNILDHTIVSPHRVLKQPEVDDIKTRYNIVNDKSFPEISRFDPVSHVIGIRPGQVCEIIRPSKTAVVGYYYRICV